MEYLFWAYGATWLVLFAYTVSLGLRQRKINQEIKWLKQMIQEKES
ncbi:CcmD family protein [Dehalobacterium formicoaceticum]|uniref:CcmD family protein n=1 Tax=Dehalobacterium formicoaceticum TaxID=51515 RepID=A0ABT1Y2L6_9FIRM|nr:CcmD family protein [Dehalobacterium formicoaceticum]MCR6545113.1 CcmD family protein [Dehalobacterium formicoaceticum]